MSDFRVGDTFTMPVEPSRWALFKERWLGKPARRERTYVITAEATGAGPGEIAQCEPAHATADNP
jgi:hypothetical protein